MSFATRMQQTSIRLLDKYGEVMTVQTDRESGESVTDQPWHGPEKRTVSSKAKVAILPEDFRTNFNEQYQEPTAMPRTNLVAYVAATDLNTPLTVGSRFIREDGLTYQVIQMREYRAQGENLLYEAFVRAG